MNKKLIARHKNSYDLYFCTSLAEYYLSSSAVKKWFLRNLKGKFSCTFYKCFKDIRELGFSWQTKIVFVRPYKIFSPLFTKADLIEAVKNEMKEYSNPTFTVAKGLDIKPKELDELKKKVIAEETNSEDYVAFKRLLERLLK